MKRIISLVLSLVLALLALMPSAAFADTMIRDYGSVTVFIPTSPNALEAEFREYVKQLAYTYYAGGYDLNKYYYDAARIKHEWDGGWGKKDNPYSTYTQYKYNDKYSLPVIQAMLLSGIQEKADSLKKVNPANYYEGLAVDPVTGEWSPDKLAILAQQQYNMTVDEAVKAARTELGMQFINTAADLTVIYVQGGNASETLARIFDVTTSSIAETVNKYAELKYSQLQTDLHNEFSEIMKQTVIDMYDNIEAELLADYTQLHSEMMKKSSLTEEEQLLRDQIGLMLEAISKIPEHQLTAYEQGVVDSVAADLVASIGLEKEEALTDAEVHALVVKHATKILLFNITEALIDTLISKSQKLTNNQKFGAAMGKTLVFEVVQDVVDAAMSEEVTFTDYNADGALNVDEIMINAYDFIMDGNLLTDAIKELIERLDDKKTSNLIEKLDKEIKEAEHAVRSLQAKKDNLLEKNLKHSSEPVKGTTVKIKEAKIERDKIKAKNDQMKREIQANSGSSVSILISDCVELVADSFKLAKEASGLGDTFDNEVFFAYQACSMYHTMQAAETRRSSLNSEYGHLRNVFEINTEEIDVLKNFVNRIYAVYETDMLGHSYYVTLDTGWNYQTTEKFDDTMDEFHDFILDVVEEKGIIKYTVGWTLGGWMTMPGFMIAGASKSEYLKKVNKDGLYGWIDLDTAYDVYEEMAEYASGAKLPDKYKSVGQ